MIDGERANRKVFYHTHGQPWLSFFLVLLGWSWYSFQDACPTCYHTTYLSGEQGPCLVSLCAPPSAGPVVHQGQVNLADGEEVSLARLDYGGVYFSDQAKGFARLLIISDHHP